MRVLMLIVGLWLCLAGGCALPRAVVLSAAANDRSLQVPGLQNREMALVPFVFGGGSMPRATVRFRTELSAEQVEEWYDRTLARQGWVREEVEQYRPDREKRLLAYKGIPQNPGGPLVAGIRLDLRIERGNDSAGSATEVSMDFTEDTLRCHAGDTLAFGLMMAPMWHPPASYLLIWTAPLAAGVIALW